MAERHLLIFGLGYAATAVARLAVAQGFRVSATIRRAQAALPGVTLVDFAAAGPMVAQASHVLVSVPPDADASPQAPPDPVLAAYATALAAARPGWIGYFSTTGIYGDHQGGWVDEATPPDPASPRAARRVAAEQGWARLTSGRLDIFRLAGIYGPGRSALDDLRAGRGRRIDKPGHVFGRIHRDDIARAVLAAMVQAAPAGPRVLNLADDAPAEPQVVIAEAARLLGLTPPRLVPFAEAESGMSAMARSFWAEQRRVGNRATKAALEIAWLYPSYREGLAAILAEQLGQGGE